MRIKYLKYIVLPIIVVITSFCILSYIYRASLDYNPEGKYFSVHEGVVYKEQTKEQYAVAAIIGLMLTGITIYRLRKNDHRRS